MELTPTKHARDRITQRGVTGRVLSAVLRHFDREIEVGGGCRALRMSHQAVASLNSQEPASRSVRGLQNLAIVEHCSTGNIVTVFWDHGQSRARRYRIMR